MKKIVDRRVVWIPVASELGRPRWRSALLLLAITLGACAAGCAGAGPGAAEDPAVADTTDGVADAGAVSDAGVADAVADVGPADSADVDGHISGGDSDSLWQDGGADTADGGADVGDTGADVADTGADPVDGGADTVDGGADPVDGGADTADGGADTVDGGADTADGGADTTDGGADVGDTGADVADTGADPGDIGADVADTGADPGDIGADVADTGADPGDTGADPADTGADPGDIGADAADTGADTGDTGADAADAGADVADAADGGGPAPTIAIVQPIGGASVSGVVSIQCELSDGELVTEVRISAGGVVLASLQAPPYDAIWDTDQAAEGAHQIEARATDSAGQVATHAVSVTVDRTAPTVEILAPSPGAVVADLVAVQVSAADSALATVTLRWDGEDAAVFTEPPFEAVLGVSGLESGVRALSATATDQAGNAATDSVDVLVDRAPTVSLDLPGAGDAVSGIVSFAALASDDLGLAQLDWLLDGASVHIDEIPAVTAFEGVYALDTTLLPMGPHSMVARVGDTSGQTAAAEIGFVAEKTAQVLLQLCDSGGVCSQPAAGAVLPEGAWTLAADVDGPVEVVQLLVAGVVFRTLTKPPYAATIHTSKLPEGTVTLSAQAMAEGAVIGSDSLLVTILQCDGDEDGYVDPLCGGTDCDDTDAHTYPGAPDPVLCEAWSGWSHQTLGAVPAVASASVIMADGAVHAVLSGVGGGVYVTNAGGSWFQVAAPPGSSAAVLAVDQTGAPHLVYPAKIGGVDALAHSTWTGAGWSVDTVAQVSTYSLGAYDVTVDSDGGVHVVYNHGSEVRYLVQAGAYWTLKHVESGWSGLTALRVVVDDESYVHIVGDPAASKPLYSTNRSGVWHLATLTGVTDIRALLVGPDGGVRLVSAEDGCPSATVRVMSNLGDGWTSEAIALDGISRVGGLSAAFDASGVLHIGVREGARSARILSHLPGHAATQSTVKLGGSLLDLGLGALGARPLVASVFGDPVTGGATVQLATPGACPTQDGVGLDEDCDGVDGVDEDGDGFASWGSPGDDCDDADPLAAPSAEICGNSVDEDCSGAIDDVDGDGDGAVDAACGGDDCDDADPAIHPGAVEMCGDSADSDCTGLPDDADGDGDGYVDAACGGPDCDDTRAGVHPGANDFVGQCSIWSEWSTVESNYGFVKLGGLQIATDGTVQVLYLSDDYQNSPKTVTIWASGSGSGASEKFADSAAAAKWRWPIVQDGLAWHLVYKDWSKLHYTTRTADAWVSVPVGPGLIESTAEFQPALAVAPDGVVHVVYPTLSDGLVVATGGLGGFSQTTVAPRAKGAHKYVSATVAPDGGLHVIYADGATGDLRYVSNVTGGWVDVSVGWPGQVTGQTGAVIDSSGNLHVLFTTALCGGEPSLREATRVGGAWFFGEVPGVATLDAVVIDAADAVHVVARASSGTGGGLTYLTRSSDGWTSELLGSDSLWGTVVMASDGRPRVASVTKPGKWYNVHLHTPAACSAVVSPIDEDCDGADGTDDDGDGHAPLRSGGDDCDDGDPLTYLGAPEVCGNGVDEDCSGVPDDLDFDGDGHLALACGGGDCDDANPDASPSAHELCGNAVDEDCSGVLDDGDGDFDGDGVVSSDCGGTDCNDTDATAYPGATEKPSRCYHWSDWGVVRQYPGLVFPIQVAVDGDGSVHAIAYSYDPKGEFYLYITDATGDWAVDDITAWFDPAYDSGEPGGLVLKADAEGSAHMLWRRKTCIVSRYHYATNATGTWTDTPIVGFEALIDGVGLAVAASGAPHAVSLGKDLEGVPHLFHWHLVSGDWVTERIDLEHFGVSPDALIEYPWLRVRADMDGHGVLHVLFPVDYETYAYATWRDGVWSGEVVPYELYDPFFAVDRLGDPLIVDYRIIRRDSASATGWIDEPLGLQPLWDDLIFALSVSGELHAVHRELGGPGGAIAHSTDASGAWTTQGIGQFDYAPEPGSMAVGVDRDGVPHVVVTTYIKEPPAEGFFTALLHIAPSTCDAWTAPVDNDCDGLDSADEDGDGFDGLAFGGDDCDDEDPAVHPGALEVCGNQRDDDCSGLADDLDEDMDGFVSTACGGPDCDDGDPAVHPGAQEICGDAVDEDCSGSTDDVDADGDGHVTAACGGDDCDDTRAEVHPGAPDPTHCTAWSQWIVETVDAGAGAATALSALQDGAGGLHVAYVDAASGAIRSASGTSGAWSVHEIGAGALPTQTSMLAVSGAISLVYGSNAKGLVRSTLDQGGWTPPVPWSGFGSSADLPARAVGAGGGEVLVTLWTKYDGKKELSARLYAPCGWNDTLASGTVKATAVGVDAGGVVHVVYAGTSAYYVYGGSGAWSNDVAVPQGAFHGGFDLDAGGAPHVSVTKAGALLHAARTGGAWTTQVVDPGAAPVRDSLDVDDQDGVHIAYDAPGQLGYATDASGAWATTQVQAAAVGGTAIVVDPWGRPHIFFSDLTFGALRYARPMECLAFGPSPDEDCSGADGAE